LTATIAGVRGELPKRAAVTGTLISAVNTALAVYGSGIISHELEDD